jgi:alpha-beta hydrolase superfamily lysophospholipase
VQRLSTVFFLAKAAAVLAVALYLAACTLLYLVQARLLFPGAFMPLPPGIEAEGAALGLQTFNLGTTGGESIHLLHWAQAPARPIVLVFHGNASYPEDYGFLYGDWIAAGYGVVAPVARGYPRSSDAPDGEGMLADALAVRDWIARTYPGHPVFVFGQSLGTGQAVHVAAHRDVAGVILISPFQSMLSLAAEKMPWIPMRLLLASPFRSDLDVPRVKAPILIFHGDQDTLIPIGHGRALASLAKAPVEFEVVWGAGHAAGLFGLPMIDRIAIFLSQNSS